MTKAKFLILKIYFTVGDDKGENDRGYYGILFINIRESDLINN